MTTLAFGSTPYLGIFNVDDPLANAANYATQTGNNPAIMHVHADWTLPLDQGGRQLLTFDEPVETVDNIEGSIVRMAQTLAQQGTMLSVSWDPMSIDYRDPEFYNGTVEPAIGLDEILSGNYDTYITEVAQQVRDMDVPIMMSLFGEANAAALFGYGPEGNEYRYTVDDQTGQYGDPAVLDGPERVRDAFRHIIDLFEAAGATNVTWYQYMGTAFGTATDSISLADIYPGDDYIDLVGTSAYMDDATGLDAALRPGYDAWAAITTNPYYIPELANFSTAPGELDAMLQGLSGYDRLVAATLVDFQAAYDIYGVPRLGDGADDWNVLTNPTGLTHDVMVDTTGGPLELGNWWQSTGRVIDPTVFQGTDGNDIIEGREQNDHMIGGAGDDIYYIDSADDVVVETAGNGYDQLVSIVSVSMHAEVEAVHLIGEGPMDVIGNELDNYIIGNDSANVVTAGLGDDIISAAGGHDEIIAGEGNDSILAGWGLDTVNGGAGDDLIEGLNGNDELRGGAGVDVLDGGAGNDTIYLDGGGDYAIGGDGADLFVFGETAAIAVIEDFDATVDRIDVAHQDIGTMSEFAAIAIDVDDGVFLMAGNNYLYLEGVVMTDITSDNLIFS